MTRSAAAAAGLRQRRESPAGVRVAAVAPETRTGSPGCRRGHSRTGISGWELSRDSATRDARGRERGCGWTPKVRRIFLEDRRHRLDGGVAPKGAPSGEQLVEDRAEGKDVGAVIGGLAPDLLGRHVADRAHDDARLGAERCGGSRGQLLGRSLDQLAQTEVEDLHAAITGHEDVLRLQVPMDDAFLVRRREIRGRSGFRSRSFARRQPSAGEFLRSVRPRAAPERRRALRSCFHVEDRRDVGMIQYPAARLLLEAAQAIGVGGKGRRQNFDGDVAAQARVPRTPDLAHPAGADRREDLVGTEPGAGGNDHLGRAMIRLKDRVSGPSATGWFDHAGSAVPFRATSPRSAGSLLLLQLRGPVGDERDRRELLRQGGRHGHGRKMRGCVQSVGAARVCSRPPPSSQRRARRPRGCRPTPIPSKRASRSSPLGSPARSGSRSTASTRRERFRSAATSASPPRASSSSR